MQGTWAQSQVRELRSHMPCIGANKIIFFNSTYILTGAGLPDSREGGKSTNISVHMNSYVVCSKWYSRKTRYYLLRDSKKKKSFLSEISRKSGKHVDFKEEPRAGMCFTYSVIIRSYTFPFLILSLLKWPHKMGCAAVSTISYLASLSLPLYPLFILMNTDWPRVESHQWLPSEISPHRWDRDFSSGAPMCLLGRRGKGRDLDDLLLGSELCL